MTISGRGRPRLALTAWATRSLTRSEAVGTDDLASGHGGDGPPCHLVDAVLDEPDRAVDHRHVDAAGVIRAGADDGVRGVVAGVVAEDAGLFVRRVDVA